MNWLNLIGTFFIECGQQLLPTLNAVAYMFIAVWIYRWGRGER